MPLNVRKLKLGTILRGYAHPMLRDAERSACGSSITTRSRLAMTTRAMPIIGLGM